MSFVERRHSSTGNCVFVCYTESSDQSEETAAPDPPPPAPITSIQDRDPVPEEQVLCVCVSEYTFKHERNISICSISGVC